MDTLIENAPQIIGEAAKSPLGLAALIVLALSGVAYLLFRSTSESARVLDFLSLVVGFIVFGIALSNVIGGVRRPNPIPMAVRSYRRLQLLKLLRA